MLLLPTVRLLPPRDTTPSPSIDPTVTPGGLWPLISNVPPPPKTSTRDVPPVESPSKKMKELKPSAISVALSAVEVSSKKVAPPQGKKMQPPKLGLLMMVA